MNPLLSTVTAEVSNLKSGEEFIVKDLFKGYVWKRLDKSTRLNLGILFLNEVRNNSSLKVTILDKTSSNQQVYLKE
ncbi:single-stranded DNA-binding protein [Clostridium sp. YIM B02505]|uniref:Single-stranded DNA-binding protein n=1 Tax=Clostridium yunnanense TaxID=2800325 RepID=A0ABS1ERD0_9CLOT|nr:single-stranded DNA-binding protein [Clostridium yunnanense]MBK1811958.1 single-stranded DNA-binding protein [Clostridium yunnanense]